jgi:hypothetical protein
VHAFFSFVVSQLVGADGEAVSVRGLEGVAAMLLQIYRGYTSLPPRELTWSEISFFYDGLRADLVALNRGR